jgi:hypothetical protein
VARCGRDPWAPPTATLARLSTPADLFVALASRPLDFYLPYFGQRRVVSVDLVASGHDEADAISAVRSLIAATAARGGRIYVYPCGAEEHPRLTELAAPALARLEPLQLGGSVAPDFDVCEAVAPPS